MQYISTRGEAPKIGFSDALLTGLARDGGLYVPQEWPQFSPADIRALRGRSYQDAAFARDGAVRRRLDTSPTISAR